MMYDTECDFCGKPMKTYAKNRNGNLPTVYCSRKCEGDAKAKLKIFDRKRFT